MAGMSFPDTPHRKGVSDRRTLRLFTCSGGASSSRSLHRKPETEESVTESWLRGKRHLHHQCMSDTPIKESTELPGGCKERSGRGRAGPVEQGSARAQNRGDLNRDQDTKMGALQGRDSGPPSHSCAKGIGRALAAGDSKHCEEAVSTPTKT